MKKKALAFVLSVALLCGLCPVAFADEGDATGGTQTITTTVPGMYISEAVISMPKPGHGGIPPVTDDIVVAKGSQFTVGSFRLNEAIPKYTGGETVSWDVSLIPNDLYYFDENTTLTVKDQNGDVLGTGVFQELEGKTAKYLFSYNVSVPSWTLQVPADVTIEYLEEEVELGKPTISDIDSLGMGKINCMLSHTGSLTGEKGAIPFSIKNSESYVPSSTSTYIGFWSVSSTGVERGIATLTMNITENAWKAAVPGTYATQITYSSELEI